MDDLLNAQKETILGRVNEVYQKKNFIDSPTDPVGPGETVIGTLNDYEKAIFSEMSFFVNKAEKTLESQKENEVNKHQLILVQESLEVLRLLFWVMIKERLGEQATKQEVLSIREGWQIVSFDQERCFSCEICFISI